MSQTEQERIDIEEQLLLDRIIFGTSVKLTHSDGTIQRVPPDQVIFQAPRKRFLTQTLEQLKR